MTTTTQATARKPVRCGNFRRSAASSEAWLSEFCRCPDCGARAKVFIAGSYLAPYAKIRAHDAPPGVTPAPYAFGTPAGFVAWED